MTVRCVRATTGVQDTDLMVFGSYMRGGFGIASSADVA